MKKIIALSALLLAACVVVAQDATTTEPLKNKKGILILPQTGEWGLGVSANPFLSYLGNFMNANSTNNSPNFNFAADRFDNGRFFDGIALFGKYVKSENTYYRARVNINIQTDIDKRVITADQSPNLLNPITEDWQKNSSQTVLIAGGIEKRRGSTRLQGLYGAELLLGYGGSKVTYEYGNPFSSANQTPTTFDFATPANGEVSATSRNTEEKFGKSVLVGARGFIGVEYFFAPRISIGGEFGYSLTVTSTGKTVTTSESWDNGTSSVLSTKTDEYRINAPTTQFRAGLDNLDGAINLLFYF